MENKWGDQKWALEGYLHKYNLYQEYSRQHSRFIWADKICVWLSGVSLCGVQMMFFEAEESINET